MKDKVDHIGMINRFQYAFEIGQDSNRRATVNIRGFEQRGVS